MAVDAANAPARAGAHTTGQAADGGPVTLSQGRPA
jgi:hypothetical protein